MIKRHLVLTCDECKVTQLTFDNHTITRARWLAHAEGWRATYPGPTDTCRGCREAAMARWDAVKLARKAEEAPGV